MPTAQKLQGKKQLNASIKSKAWKYIISKPFRVASNYNSKIK